MTIALASPPVAPSVDEALGWVARQIAEAAGLGARVVCFPEAYVPGLRGVGVDVPPFVRADHVRVVEVVSEAARARGVGVVLGTERWTEAGRHIAAAVVDPDGRLQGVQLKAQLDPAEEAHYVAGTTRRLFEIDGLRFGVAICHEAFRYPETVRWAARRGAQVVFHPHWTGSDTAGETLTAWGSPDAPYYERAVMCRALENTVYVASVTVATRFHESATAVIDPSGACLASLPYGEPGVLAVALDLGAATGRLAARLAPERYPA